MEHDATSLSRHSFSVKADRIMLHHETPINKRQIALTAGFVGYAFKI